MRVPTTRLFGALAIGGVLLTSAACGAVDNAAACTNIKKEVQALGSSAGTLTSNPAAAAKAYNDTAAKVRTHGQEAGGEVETAAGKLATELENLAKVLQEASAGNPKVPDTSAYINAAKQVDTACS